MFGRMEISETIYGGVVEPSYKKLLEQMIIMLVTAGKLEEMPPYKKFTQRWVNALASASKGV